MNLLQLWKLSGLNEFYNLQDSIILCETFEKRAEEIMKKLSYNPLKCTSASSLSDSIHRYSLEVLILLPTQAEFVKVFKTTLIGSFSCVNTRLAFKSKILVQRRQTVSRTKILSWFTRWEIRKVASMKIRGLFQKLSKWMRTISRECYD